MRAAGLVGLQHTPSTQSQQISAAFLRAGRGGARKPASAAGDVPARNPRRTQTWLGVLQAASRSRKGGS